MKRSFKIAALSLLATAGWAEARENEIYCFQKDGFWYASLFPKSTGFASSGEIKVITTPRALLQTELRKAAEQEKALNLPTDFATITRTEVGMIEGGQQDETYHIYTIEKNFTGNGERMLDAPLKDWDTDEAKQLFAKRKYSDATIRDNIEDILLKAAQAEKNLAIYLMPFQSEEKSGISFCLLHRHIIFPQGTTPKILNDAEKEEIGYFKPQRASMPENPLYRVFLLKKQVQGVSIFDSFYERSLFERKPFWLLRHDLWEKDEIYWNDYHFLGDNYSEIIAGIQEKKKGEEKNGEELLNLARALKNLLPA
ncbi:MAG: hypothetical protein M1549_00070 [Candidatus Dependentiae bacterium]|nr:hypothetical protein [Candidatus Dependentiae bacterium]